MTQEVSHGRGGAGNINVDDTPYVDGAVVRTGAEGSHGDGVYSAGRGGAGNICDVGEVSTDRRDEDIIPESAIRDGADQDFHTGRGGAGNEHLSDDHEEERKKKKKQQQQQQHAEREHGDRAASPAVGLADKLKEKLFGALKK